MQHRAKYYRKSSGKHYYTYFKMLFLIIFIHIQAEITRRTKKCDTQYWHINKE